MARRPEARGRLRPLAADDGAAYDEGEVIELRELEPLIAKPSSPGNVVPVRDVAGTQTVQVCVGSSVNSSYEDLATVAAVLRENVVHPRVEMTVTPGSRQILDTISRSGVYQDLVARCARMLEPVCGPCIGVGQAPSAGVPSVRTFNRNFPGRSGTAGDRGLPLLPGDGRRDRAQGRDLRPARAGEPPPSRPRPRTRHRRPPDTGPAATGGGAIASRSSEARTSCPRPRASRSPRRSRDDHHSRRGRRLHRGHGPRRRPGYEPLVRTSPSARSTCSAGRTRSSTTARWSGAGFHRRRTQLRAGLSREHAALAPLYLGIRAIVAKSFARIHRRNLICQGILPLLFADEEDYERVNQGDAWKIEGVREVVEGGETGLVVKGDAGRGDRARSPPPSS